MKLPSLVPVSAVFLPIAVAVFATGAAFAEEKKPTVTNLLQEPLGVADGIEVVSYLVEGPAGGAPVPKHRHNGDEILYVMEGAVTIMPEGMPSVTVEQGEMYHPPYGVPHSAANASQTEPVKVLVFHVKEAGKPVSEPVN